MILVLLTNGWYLKIKLMYYENKSNKENQVNILEKQSTLVENFNFFDDWSDKYAYLIGLGKSLKFPDDKKDQAHLIKGCQSQVWFDVQCLDGKLIFHAISDAAIVSGLIGLLLEVYNNSTPEEILNSDILFMETIGLSRHLSSTRNNGLHAMLNFIYASAKQHSDINA